jgi:predicted RecA/RadA family phage recombinase
MNAVFRQRGDAIDYIPAAGANAGDVVVQSQLVGIVKLDIAPGARGALAVSGVFDMPKNTGEGTRIGVGAKLRWDADLGYVIQFGLYMGDDPDAPPYVGKAIAAAEEEDATVQVRLDQ